MNKIITLLAFSILIGSCNQYEKAPSGMLYKITHGNGNEKLLQQGQYVKLNVEYKLKSKDTILSTTFGVIPVYFPINTDSLGKYTFTEVIMKCRKGDKIEFSLSIDTLVSMKLLQLNEVFKTKDIILGRAEIVDVFTDVKLVDEDYKKEQDKEKAREIGIKPEIKKNKTEPKNVEKRKESKPKNYYGVWLGDAGRGQTYELYINTDGTWYFINNWSRRELGGFYVNKGGGSFDLMRPTDNSEKIVYNGLESITEFYFQAGGSNGSLRPNTNRAGLAFQDNVPFYIQ